MEKQITMTDVEYASRRKKTRRELFLETMDKIVPWHRLCSIIKPYYYINWEKTIEAKKSAVRWKVEYPFYIVKRIFGCDKAIYRGIKKNGCCFDMAFVSANLYMFRHRLLQLSI